MLVASGNMPRIHDKAFTLGRKSGNYHCCAAAQIACADNGAPEIAHTPHRRLPPLNGDISAEAAKLLCVSKARVKNVFDKIGSSYGFEKRRHKQRLHIRRKFGIRPGRNASDSVQLTVGYQPYAPARRYYITAGSL